MYEDKKEVLRTALQEASDELERQGNFNIKSYEIAFQEAIESIWPDNSWWEIVKPGTDIFGAMFYQDLTPEQTIEYILDNLK